VRSTGLPRKILAASQRCDSSMEIVIVADTRSPNYSQPFLVSRHTLKQTPIHPIPIPTLRVHVNGDPIRRYLIVQLNESFGGLVNPLQMDQIQLALFRPKTHKNALFCPDSGGTIPVLGPDRLSITPETCTKSPKMLNICS
jgi:hypothetical protein